MRKITIVIASAILLGSLSVRPSLLAARQADTVATAPDTAGTAVLGTADQPAPLILGPDTLLTISVRVGPFTAMERVRAIRSRLEALVDDPLVSGDSVKVVNFGNRHELYCRGSSIMAITDADAGVKGMNRADLAEQDRGIIAAALDREIKSSSLFSILMRVLVVSVASLALVLLVGGLNRLARILRGKVNAWATGKAVAIRIQKAEFVSTEKLVHLSTFVMRVAIGALIVFLVYIYLGILFGQFPATRGITETLINLVMVPVRSVWEGLVSYLPNLFFIAVIVIFASLVIRLLRWFATEVEKGTIELPGFYREWSDPTYKLVRFIVLAFALVVVFPYLPGSGSPAFQGVGVFLGLLLSLGSASAISNMVAGFVLIYMRAFNVGDRVRVADTVGDVIEKSLLVTRIRTTKNVDITVPNGLVLGSHIINYSSMAGKQGLILHTSVTIGYDAPWRTVHDLLIAAALTSERIIPEPRPFVLQKSLSDFYVEYEINAYTNDSHAIERTYSALRANIQDRFNEAGVEIMSPHYTSVRDGNATAVPDEYIPPAPPPRAFRIFPISGLFGKGGKDEGKGGPG